MLPTRTPLDAIVQLRFVAMCDVLGFRQLLVNLGTLELAQRYRFLVQLADDLSYTPVGELDAFPETGTRLADDGTDLGQGHVVFSDSILMWSAPIDRTPGCGEEGLRSAPTAEIGGFVARLAALIAGSIICEMPVRIGIAFGETLLEPSRGIYVGPAIVDAYLTEARQEWLGGAFHQSCGGEQEFGELLENQLVLRTAVPVKSNYDPAKEPSPQFALNWCLYEDRAVTDRFVDKRLAEARSAVQAAAKPDEIKLWQSIELKWLNTAAYREAVHARPMSSG
jgi:hypothetical protein